MNGELVRPVLLSLAAFTAGMVVVEGLPYDPRNLLVLTGLQVVLAVVVAVIAFLWTRGPRTRRWAVDLTVAATSVLPALVLAVALHGSRYQVGGLGIAAANRTPAVARYLESWALTDYSYEGLPAFYPPLMPWLAGRAGAVLDLSAPLALKLTGIVMLFAAPLLSFVLWRRLVPTAVAAFAPLAVVALLVVTPGLLQQADSLLALAVVVPWWLDAVYGLRRTVVAAWPVWVHALIGALVVCLYYYYFFPLAVALLLLPLLRPRGTRTSVRSYLRPVLVLALTVLLSAVYWLPLLVSLVRAEQPASLQNLWFLPEHARLSVHVFDATPVGVLMLAGLVHLAVTVRRSRLSTGLALMLAAGYGWYVLALGLAVLKRPVLAFRTEAFVELIMLMAGVRAVAALVVVAVALAGRAGRLTPRDAGRGVAVVGLALVFVIGQGAVTGTLSYPHVRSSHDTPLPDGRLQRYASRGLEPPTVSDRALERTVRRLAPPDGEDPVVLSTRSSFLKTSGLYVFNQWHAIYAHPAGEYPSRLRFLRRLSREDDPDAFAAMARGNRFDPIDVFVLRARGDEQLVYRATRVRFPRGPRQVRLLFRRSQFSAERWRVVELGPYVVLGAR